ncbi:MAG: cell wall hydrolase [Oscillospiraceae bacterium]
MKHNRTSETPAAYEKEIKKSSVKKVGAALSIGAISMFAIGTVGVFGLSTDDTASPVSAKAQTAAQTAITAGTTVPAQTASDLVAVASISLWKAGVEEYDFSNAEVSEETSVTTVTTPEETTAKKTTTKAKTTTAPVTTTEKITTTEQKESYKLTKYDDDVTMYTTGDVNLRKGPGTDYTKLTTLSEGKKVSVIGVTDTGWYKVEVSEKSGYIKKSYLSKDEPEEEVVTTVSKESETHSRKTVVSCTDTEREMMYYIVEAEVGGCSEKSKLAVANVIINRAQSSRFPDTIKGVLTARGQFSTIGNYYDKYRTPTKSTKDCVDRALAGEDNSKGAVYFYSPKNCGGSTSSWFESLTFCMSIDGQRYFK